MAYLVAFHYVMRLLFVFVMCTLKAPPDRLTLQNHNLPYDVINGFILISCLFLVCSAVHLSGVIRRRLTMKLIALSIVVASCCLVVNAITLRRILKYAAPESISILDPKTIIIDVDRRGWLSISNVQFNLATMNKILEFRLTQHPSNPIIICADRRAPFSTVLRIAESCQTAGATDVSLAKQIGFDRFTVPAFKDDTIPSDADTVTTVLVQRDYVELNGRRLSFEEMDRVVNDYVKHQAGQWYDIKISDDAPYAYLTILLKAFQDYGATNVVWALSQ